MTADQTRLQTAFDATNEDSDGILMRLEALDRLGDRNATLAAAQLMLTLLFMSIEILPVLMKLLLNFGPPSAYDRLAARRRVRMLSFCRSIRSRSAITSSSSRAAATVSRDWTFARAWLHNELAAAARGPGDRPSPS